MIKTRVVCLGVGGRERVQGIILYSCGCEVDIGCCDTVVTVPFCFIEKRSKYSKYHDI